MFPRNRIRLFCIVTVFISSTLCNDVQVTITPKGPIDKPAGTPFVATCNGEAENRNLFTKMKWTGSRGDITQDEGEAVYSIQNEPGSLFLQFNNPSREMSGIYNCTAVYDNTIVREGSLLITFYHPITFEDCPDVQALVIGRSGAIRCKANANPNAQVSWAKDMLPLDKNRYQIHNDGVHVTDVRETDAGTYQMKAVVQRTGELRVRNIAVQVQVPPEITELKEHVEVVQGERSELTCQASGKPPPQYVWLDPSQRDLSSVDGFIVDKNTGILTIRDVHKDYAGAYKCQASNNAGKVEKQLQLTVLVKPEIRKFDNVTQVEDKDAILECRSTGEPAPEMSIRKDGHEYPLASGDDRIHIKKSKEGEESILVLTIRRIMRTDDGLYYCAANNEAGHAERVGHLTVEFAPDMTSTPATERKTWNEIPVNLTCVADAIPNATITWYFRNLELRNDETYRIYGTTSYSSLLVTPNLGRPGGNDIYGKYRCEGRNQYGNNSVEINLQEARVPGRIQQITFDKQTATTVTFHLRGLIDDGGLPITSFMVKYYEFGLPEEIKTYKWPEGTSYILGELKPRTKYILRFAAENAAGVGDFSDEQVLVMPAESAPEAPVFITPGGNVSSYPDTFRVQWVVPQDNGKPIQKFDLRYFQVEPVGISNTEWNSVGTAKTAVITDWQQGANYKLTGLRANSYYKVELRAHNEIGNSQVSSMVFQTAHERGSSREEQQRLEEGGGILTTPAIVAIVIVVVLVVLGLLDLTCYMRYQCGFFYCLRTTVCGRSPSPDKAKEAAEDVKGKERTRNADGHLLPGEDTPMIESAGAKDTKNADSDDYKNKSPKGSKSSIAKDSLV